MFDRVKVCFECKEYMIIFPESAINREYVEYFEQKHLRHMTQTVNLSEIDKNVYRMCEKKR